MIDLVKVNDRTKRVMDEMFEFMDVNDVTFYVYKAKDFPFMKNFCDEIVDSFDKYEHRRTKQIVYFKSYKRNTVLVMFTILLNNRDINDISYQYENMSNFVKVASSNVDVFQVILNCQYSSYQSYLNVVSNSIKNYLAEKNNNRAGRIDSLEG